MANNEPKKENTAPAFYTPGRLFSLRSRNRDDLITEIKIAAKALAVGIIGGFPIALLVLGLALVTDLITFSIGFSVPSYAEIFNIGLNVGLGFVLLLGTLILTPVAWRRFSNPKTLIKLAYLSVVTMSVSVGLLIPDIFTSWWIVWWLGGLSTTAWWTWNQRWRGAGVAPSPLAGVLRPELHPGQIWFASIKGRKETKVRPVMVLSTGPRASTWYVAYFTSQAPRNEQFESMYLKVERGTLRGINLDNWITLADIRTLTRGDFRTYTGIAPTWLYASVCKSYDIQPDGSAHTVDEEKAGERPAPTHLAVLSALGLRKPRTDNSQALSEATQSWKTTIALINLPIESRKDRRERSQKQYEASKKTNNSSKDSTK